MSRKPAPPTHKAAPRRPTAVNLFALPSGGFQVADPQFAHYGQDRHGNTIIDTATAAFSTLEEALEWLRVNMARPAEEKLPA